MEVLLQKLENFKSFARTLANLGRGKIPPFPYRRHGPYYMKLKGASTLGWSAYSSWVISLFHTGWSAYLYWVISLFILDDQPIHPGWSASSSWMNSIFILGNQAIHPGQSAYSSWVISLFILGDQPIHPGQSAYSSWVISIFIQGDQHIHPGWSAYSSWVISISSLSRKNLLWVKLCVYTLLHEWVDKSQMRRLEKPLYVIPISSLEVLLLEFF